MATQTRSNRKRLFLIDGYAMLYRAHFAMIKNPLITSYGLHTSALFGFINQLFRLLRQEEPDYLAAVFDTSEKTFRHERYPEYKATREKMPEELRDQLPYLWKLLEALQIVTLSKPGFEADDLIGTLAKTASEEGLDVYIVSGDKDFMQLVNDHVFMVAPSGRNVDIRIIDRSAVVEKWGVPPEKIIDLLGLMGDSSDNIPGVKGVGVKSAVKLLEEYGSLQAALDHADQVTNKRVQSGLKECREEALLSQELVTIVTDVDVDTDVHNLVRSEFNYDELDELFHDLEFKALFQQLGEFRSELNTKVDRSNKRYQIITSTKDLKHYINNIDPSNFLSLDLETTSTDPMRAEVVGISFSTRKDEGVYIPIRFQEKEKEQFGDDDLEQVLSMLKPILEDATIRKTGQNLKYDILILKRHGIRVKGVAFDTLIAAHLINPASRSYKLETLSLEYLNYRMIPIKDLIGSGRNQITMDQVPLEKVAFYAAEDADIALQLTAPFNTKLRTDKLDEYFLKVEIPLIPVLVQMEFEGLYVDRKKLEHMSRDLRKKLDALTRDILRTAGTEFNINSTQQLAHILFDILELPQVRKRSTAEEVLERLKENHPLPALILEYRKFNKLRNTYVDALPELIHPETGRIHSSFNQTVAATGRLSSSNPNFQNIPIRRDEGREIRKAFRAQKKGWKIFSADYSQIELRIMAHLSRDRALMDAFQQGEDIHIRTASDVFGVPLKDVLPEMRRTAKVVNFGIMYGAGPYRMSQELGIPRSEAQTIIDAYFERYAGIKSYIADTLDQARSEHVVKTILGRKRPVWDADSENRMRREAAERMAINMPIQGTAAEMIKLAMISIHDRMVKEGLNSRMVLQVHDELLFEAPEGELETLTSLVVEEMENALPLSVPVVVDWGVGDSWFDAH